MPPRLRKLVGTIVLVAFVCVYALTAMTIAAAKLPGTSGLVQLVYFVVAGLHLGHPRRRADRLDAKARPERHLARFPDLDP